MTAQSTKSCLQCGLAFTPRWSFQTYCTAPCRHLGRTARRAARRRTGTAPAPTEAPAPSPVPTRPAQSCPGCGRGFPPTWSFQFYCSASCRQRLKRKRRSERTQKANAKAGMLTEQTLLAQANAERDRAGRPRLKPNHWLTCRAAMLEAEAQMQAWGVRYQARREKLEALEMSNLQRTAHTMNKPGELKIPDEATEIGIAASGSIAILVYGAPKK